MAKIKKKFEDECPLCHANHSAAMMDYEFYGDFLSVRLCCGSCGALWKEYFNLTYDGYSFNGIVFNKEGEEGE